MRFFILKNPSFKVKLYFIKQRLNKPSKLTKSMTQCTGSEQNGDVEGHTRQENGGDVQKVM